MSKCFLTTNFVSASPTSDGVMSSCLQVYYFPIWISIYLEFHRMLFLIQECSLARLTNVLQVAVKKMKRKFYFWEECINLREVKVGGFVLNT